MSLPLIATLLILGAIGGFSAGLLGFGGGVLMFPLLYYVPPLLGLTPIDAKTVAAMVMTQVFFAAMVGGLAHLRSGRVDRHIVLVAGAFSAVGSFAGGVASKWTSENFLLLLFGIITLAVAAMMFFPPLSRSQEQSSRHGLNLPMVPLSLCALFTGVTIGFLGAGNFVFVPLLIYVMKVPTRTAIGSSLFIALMNTAFGFTGKFLTGQIPIPEAATVVLGAAVGALIGEKIHGKLSGQTLRYLYATLVGLITLRIWLTILGIGV